MNGLAISKGAFGVVTAGFALITLSQIDFGASNLEGVVISTGPDGREIHDFDTQETDNGVTLYKNNHNYISCVDVDTDSITQDGQLDNEVRYWIYEFTGDECQQWGRDETGNWQCLQQEWNGDFYISDALNSSNPGLQSIDRLREFEPGKEYYVMTEQNLHFSCDTGIETDVMVRIDVDELDKTYPYNVDSSELLRITTTTFPVPVMRFAITTDRDMEFDEIMVQQGYHKTDQSGVFPGDLIEEISLWVDSGDGVTADQKLNAYVSTDPSTGDTSINLDQAIIIPRMTPRIFEIKTERIEEVEARDNIDAVTMYIADFQQFGTQFIDIDGVIDVQDRPKNWKRNGICYDEMGSQTTVRCDSLVEEHPSVPQLIYIPVTQQAECGNGNLENGEQCDLGDTNSGDGCDSSCNAEIGFTCDDTSCTRIIPNLPNQAVGQGPSQPSSPGNAGPIQVEPIRPIENVDGGENGGMGEVRQEPQNGKLIQQLLDELHKKRDMAR